MQQKRANFGMKFWMVCDDATYLALLAILYVGKEKREVELGKHATLSLMEACKNMGLNAITDTFASSFNLAKKLLPSKIATVDTMKAY